MRSYAFSSLLEIMLSKIAFLRRVGKRNDYTGPPSAPRLSRKRDILLAFVIVSLPLLVISILLLAFIFLSDRERPASYAEIPVLPFLDYPSPHAFYTKVEPGSFLLVGSWASNIAEMVVAPFMVLFSYAVAREILLHATSDDEEEAGSRPPLLREIMRGAHVGIWHWVAQKTYKRPKRALGKEPALHIVDIAGLGLFTATLLTVMVIVGDNWLHVATQAVHITHYDNPTNYTENQKSESPGVGSYQAGFSTIDRCDDQLTAALPQNVSTAPLPCSLNKTDGLTNVAYPSYVYLTLGTGISQVSSDFNGLNFTNLEDEEQKNIATPYQVVTYSPDTNVSHSLLFYPDAAVEYDKTDYGFGTHFGIDYVANTTSMVTQCTFATQECDIHTATTDLSDGNNISIPFHCYDDFSGNLGQTPATGHERAQGWNMSFYQLVNGSPTNIPVQTQSNPFHFYIATAVNSIDLPDFDSESNLPEGNPGNGSLVDAGQGFTAFALSCEATVYDVTFSIINGSFWDFNTSISSPQKASIVQAPLQVGFGQYHLYQAASLAVLANNDSVAKTMGKAFSQTGIALASGVFDFDNNIQQRFRWTVSVTKVPKAPFFYLVVVCLVYSIFGMVMTVLALHLRRRPEIKNQQAKLMVEWGPALVEMDPDEEDKKLSGKRDQEEDGSSRRSSSDVTNMFS